MTQNKEVSIEDMNEAICKFMGGYRRMRDIDIYKGLDEIEWEDGTYLKYHSDWNWLMDCWARFRVVVSDHFDEDYPAEYCSMCDIWALECEHVNIHGAHKLLYKAITWYNTTLK